MALRRLNTLICWRLLLLPVAYAAVISSANFSLGASESSTVLTSTTSILVDNHELGSLSISATSTDVPLQATEPTSTSTILGVIPSTTIDQPTVSPILDPLNATFPIRLSNQACPSIWTQVATVLRQDFAGCNDLARSSIRFAFHDAAGYSSNNFAYPPASGGADGSLLLSEDEIARFQNAPMPAYRMFLLYVYYVFKDRGVGAADLIQFAASVGIRSCGGPVCRTVVGRQDDPNACPDGTLPAPFGPGSTYSALTDIFAAKGISPRELAALIGAHTVSQSFTAVADGIPAGSPQDSTPLQWDNLYFQQTQNPPPGVFRFASDVNLAAAGTESGQGFVDFANDSGLWAREFTAAMFKLSTLGIPGIMVSTFIDCTGLIYF